MTRVMRIHIAILGVAAIGACSTVGVAMASPPVPPPPTADGGSGTTTPQVGGGASPPASLPAPPKVTSLVVATKPGAITVRWSLPSTSISSVIVRRGVGDRCPTWTDEGVGIGGSGERVGQTDFHVRPGARYCYTVFSEGQYGVGSVTRTALASPPAPVTNVVAVAAAHHVTVSWSPSAGAAAYVVRAGSACPSAITTGRLVARAEHPVAVDRRAVPGASYCYSVFALDRYHTHLAAATSNHVIAQTPPSSSPAIASSSLVKAVSAIVLGGVLLLTAMAFLMVRLNTRYDRHYGHPPRGGRAAIGGYASSALVIPVAITVVGLVLSSRRRCRSDANSPGHRHRPWSARVRARRGSDHRRDVFGERSQLWERCGRHP